MSGGSSRRYPPELRERPDVWTAFAGSLPTATAVLGRWPDIRLLAGAPTRNWRRSTTG